MAVIGKRVERSQDLLKRSDDCLIGDENECDVAIKLTTMDEKQECKVLLA